MEGENNYRFHYGGLWEKKQGKVIADWWESLDENRRDRAKLRRCEDPNQVMFQSVFHNLMCSFDSWPKNRVFGMAMAAGILSAIKENEKGFRFGQQLKQRKSGGGSPRVSETRFTQLQKSRSPEEFYIRLRRIIQLLENKANVLSLTDYILQWDRENGGYIPKKPIDRLQFLLAQDYYS